MDKKCEEKVSRLLCLILRHKPEEINLTLDEHGYADVNELIQGLKNKGYIICLEDLKKIVKEDEKERYAFKENYLKIRANQGHSINVDVELKEEVPPAILYHGTGRKYIDSILKNGIVSKSRQYVHLSTDIITATKVGSRHGEVMIFIVDTKRMHENGLEFYLSENKIWLTREVPKEYLTALISGK